MKLNDTAIKNLEPPERGQRIFWDDSLKGFGLRVTAGGSRSFVVESRIHGKTVRRTIGPYGTLTTAEARKEAKSELGDMARGKDRRVKERRDKAESVTLRQVASEYMESRTTKSGKPLKDRTKKDIRRHVEVTFKPWAGRPIKSITRDMVRRRYKDLCGRSVAQANQSFRVLQGLINYAMRTQRAPDGSRIIADNPCEVLRDASLLQEVKPRDNAVPLDKLGHWWSEVGSLRTDASLTRTGRAAADVVAFMALTGLRAGEAQAIRWDDLNLDAGTLSLTDTKNRTDITLPLSRQALAIVDARPRGGEFVFPGRSGGHLKDPRIALSKLADRTGVEVSRHDLRRTFIRIGAKALGIELYRVKRLSNHKVPAGDVTQAHYLGEDVTAFRDEAQRVADYLDTEAAKHEGANVVALRGVKG